MRKIAIHNTRLALSLIGFGTDSLHHVRGVRARWNLILAALDNGVTHFDTSPYYGYGTGEVSLSILSSRADAVTVATKVGLYPPGGADLPPSWILARKALGKLLPAIGKPIADLTVKRAQRSLDGSLRRLKREWVDLLLLHEPDQALLATEEWMRWLDQARDRVGAVGIAAEPLRVLPFARANSPLAQVIQTRDSLSGREANALRHAGRSPQITFGHLSKRDPALPVGQVIRRTVQAFPQTVLLVRSRSPEHIRELCRSAD